MKAYNEHKRCNNGVVPTIKSGGFVFELFTVETKLRAADYVVGGAYKIMSGRASVPSIRTAWGLTFHRTIHTGYDEPREWNRL